MLYAVIMAGGIGSRFWPMSRNSSPKQTLPLLSEKPMMRETIDRLKGFIPTHQILVSTRKDMEKTIKKIVPDHELIVEPLGKNTGPSIGLITEKLFARDKDAVIITLPSDHYIEGNGNFLEDLRIAAKEAEKDKIVTIGITPTRASTALGYIEKGNSLTGKVFSVKRFVEKPPLEKAIDFVESGNFVWNAGMFIFKASKMREELRTHAPKLFEGLERIKDSGFDGAVALKEFAAMEKIQIDYAVMEKSRDLVMVEAGFGWEDIADFAAIGVFLKKDRDGNAVKGNFLGLNARDNIVYSKKLVAGIDIKDLIIVETEDAILVCPKQSSQKTKELIEFMQKDKKYGKYL